MNYSERDYTVLYFYKNEDGDRVPFLVSNGDKLSVMESITIKEENEKIQTDFPETKDNLYALIEGVVFKLQV